MTRLWYGGAPADFVIAQGLEAEIFEFDPSPPGPVASGTFGTAMLLPLVSTTLDAYTDAALTTPTTDLLDGSGGSIEQVVSLVEFGNRATIPRFQGPDGHEGSLWLSADSGVTGFRFDPESDTLYVRVGAAEDALATAAMDITALEADVVTLDGRLDTLEARTPSPNVQVFTSDGTWNKPAGARKVFAECQGGGGAGGGAAATAAGQNSEGSGGGGGGYAAKWFDAADLGSTEAITVGAGGTGVSGANGNAGGSSDFGAAHFGCDGGGGGRLGVASSTALTNAVGNYGSAYDSGSGTPSIIRRGGMGRPGIIIGGVAYRLNAGGSSEGSGEQRLTPATASGAGIAGVRGGGGSGARNSISQSARAGGAGGDGYVRVTTYF